MRNTTLTVLAIVLLCPAVLAQEGGGKKKEKFDVAKAMKQVDTLLRQSEKLLVDSLKAEENGKASAAEKSGQKTQKAIEDLLNKSRSSGDKAQKKMLEILEKAPRGKGGGGGGDQKSEKPNPENDAKRKAKEKKLEDRNPHNSGGKPSPAEQKKDQRAKNRTKPKEKQGKPAKPNPRKDWLAQLPPELRQEYENRDWRRIPEQWKKFLEDYFKRVAEAESSGSGH